MRTNGTKYEMIDKLPGNAMPVSKFAEMVGMQVGHVYVKHDRYFLPKDGQSASSNHPGYEIKCWMGTNYVIRSK